MIDTSQDMSQLIKRNQYSFFAVFFLLTYWWVGFDGITFSDDVYYLLAGKNFWNGSMEVSDYHFSSRWGAYVPAGLIGFLCGNDPHTVSAISFIAYIGSFLLLIRLVKKPQNLLIMSLWFCTQVYFLHFLTKVYPDSLLVFWTCLIPFAAIYRHEHPLKAGIALVLGLFCGFLTKETIIFLAPLPFLLYFFDRKDKSLNNTFYISILATGLLLSLLYLGYFWIEFGDPLYRIKSINAGHYISEFTYADKGKIAILKRITFLPFQTFVERAYWPWMVFAIPGLVYGLKNRKSNAFIFSIALIFIMLGFWFMSSTLAFYNPIYLNPRHLIIVIPILAYLIGKGWGKWQHSTSWKTGITSLLAVGILLSFLNSDLKMAAFHGLLALPVWIKKPKLQTLTLGIILIVPAMYSIYFQKNLKQYDNLIDTLTIELQSTDSKGFIYTHSFLDFSKELLFPGQEEWQSKIIPLYKFPENDINLPPKFKVVIYDYFQHAYPDEQRDINAINLWLVQNYDLVGERRSKNIQVYDYVLR